MPSSHPAPPYMRQAKPGKAKVRLTMTAPANGKTSSNMSVAPLAHTNGRGERVLYNDRQVKVNEPLIG